MYNLIKPLLFQLDPEDSHNLVHRLLMLSQKVPGALDFISYLNSFPSSRLAQNIWGLGFKNPLGIAAGFDKNANIVDAMTAMGFGFLELGSVTLNSSEGNQKPRLFRLLKDDALINRMGLNNKGPEHFIRNLKLAKSPLPRFINISKTNDPSLQGSKAIEDFVKCYEKIADNADVIVINLSCPNTKDGKSFENYDILSDLLSALNEKRKFKAFPRPLLLKFSSDIEFDLLDKLIDLAINKGVEGFVLSNTSVTREGLLESRTGLSAIGQGGLSGAPIFKKSLARVSRVYQHTSGKVPIIGVGGILSGADALNMIYAGASLLEVYTGLVFKGPRLISEILEKIEQELGKRDLISVEELRGLRHY